MSASVLATITARPSRQGSTIACKCAGHGASSMESSKAWTARWRVRWCRDGHPRRRAVVNRAFGHAPGHVAGGLLRGSPVLTDC